MSLPRHRTTVGPRRGLWLLGAACLLLASLPWQIQQWQEIARINRITAGQEKRAREIGRMRAALAASQDRLLAAPQDPAARLAVAVSLVQTGDRRGAAVQLHALEPAAGRSPEFADAVAELYQQIGAIDRAVVLARAALRMAPQSPGAQIHLALLDIQLGWQKEGEALLRSASHRTASAELDLALALAATQSGDLAAAERELASARRQRPGDWRILSLLADNLDAQHRSADALAAITDALRLAPQQPKLYAQQAAFLLDQARMQPAGGAATVAAISAARQCLALDPTNTAALDTLGSASLDRGQQQEARRAWEQAAALGADRGALGLKLGHLLVQQGETARGLRLFAQAQQATADATEYNRLVTLAGMDPGDPARHRLLARWCMTHRRFPRAAFEWQEVLAHLPHDSEALKGLPAAQAQAG